jgi:hypothetical protein
MRAELIPAEARAIARALHDPVDYRIVFARCAVLTGTPARTRTSDDGSMVSTDPDPDQGQGQGQGVSGHGWSRATTGRRCVPSAALHTAPSVFPRTATDGPAGSLAVRRTGNGSPVLRYMPAPSGNPAVPRSWVRGVGMAPGGQSAGSSCSSCDQRHAMACRPSPCTPIWYAPVIRLPNRALRQTFSWRQRTGMGRAYVTDVA